MSERQALLRAVAETPDDDAPRLVYADWLEEHGEPDQAELIRVSCQLARLPSDRPLLLLLQQHVPPFTSNPPPGWVTVHCWHVPSTIEPGQVVDVVGPDG